MPLDPSVYEGLPSFAVPQISGPQRRGVVVLGAGPVGLALAAGLARHGTPCTVIEPRTRVSFGSRAICLSRRSLEILEGFGVAAPILAAGLPWTRGSSFWRGHKVLEFAMPQAPADRHPPMLNLQQCFTEQLLVEGLAGRPEVELRWGHRLLGLAQREDAATLRIAAPSGDYELTADWVVACDGARSPAREALGLRLEGTSHEGRYLIADIRLRSPSPTERRAWFDPPGNRGSTVLMHRQPRDIWRIDYQLRPEEDAEAAQQEAAVRARIDAHLAAIGEPAAYELVLISLYRAHCLTLDRYRHGRVLFAGDAAHLVPIFGVRGLNSGIDDAGNLAWKLAAVVRGESPGRLLDSYSAERVFAARENIRAATKSTLFMTPPSRGHALLRDAALSLAVSQEFARALVDPRQSSAIAFPDSPLQTREQGGWADGPPPGATLPSTPLGETHVQALVGPLPTLLLAPGGAGPELPGCQVVRLDMAAAASLGCRGPGAGYLVRPDGHVAWRWQAPDRAALLDALARLAGH